MEYAQKLYNLKKSEDQYRSDMRRIIEKWDKEHKKIDAKYLKALDHLEKAEIREVKKDPKKKGAVSKKYDKKKAAIMSQWRKARKAINDRYTPLSESTRRKHELKLDKLRKELY